MRDDNVYVKTDNGRYRPFGLVYNHDFSYLPDGIWYVRHHDYSVGHTNTKYLGGLYKVGNKECVEIPRLCGMHDYTEYVLNSDEMRNIMDNGSYTWQELVSKIVALVVNKNSEYLKSLKHENSSTR